MTWNLIGVSALAVTLGLTATPSLAESQVAWRLFVADQAEPIVRVLDSTSGATEEIFRLDGPASLATTGSGRVVFAVQRDAGLVSAISSGISIDDHGEHGDLRVEPAKLLDLRLTGQRPSHFVDHHGEIALFFDGDGAVKLIQERAVLENKADVRHLALAAPHHGVAISFGDKVLATEPHPESPRDELPVGIKVIDSGGNGPGPLHECPDLHGEAASGSLVAIACKTGLLLVKAGTSGPEIVHLPYSSALPDGKSTTLVGGKGLQYFLGNYGPQAVVLIDPASKDAFRLIELPARRVHFAVDPARPRFAYIFTEDGQLHQLNVVTAKIEKSLALTEPYSMDGHWNLPRPRIAIAGDDIILTDPLKSRLLVVDATTFDKDREMAVEGKPYNVVAVGGSGEVHE